MSPFRPNPDTPSENDALHQRLIHRSRMINQIHEALQSTLNERSLHSVIAATLIAHEGMDFSRALLFTHDPLTDRYPLATALGSLDVAAHRKILGELQEEEMLDRAVTEPEGLELDWINEETLFQSPTSDHGGMAPWTRIAQKYESRNPIVEKLLGVTLTQRGTRSGDQTGDGGLLARLLSNKSSLVVSADALKTSHFPAPLKDVLVKESLWGVVRTEKGPRMLIVVDKLFDESPIDEFDQLHLDWFCGQVRLALERIELIQDLRETNESLKVLDTLKSNFLSTVSHELRSPLTAITGFTRLLANQQLGPLTDRQREILDRVLHHGDKLINIINDLIEIAEIDSGITVNIHMESVDPLNVLMETLPKLEPRRASKNAVIEPVVQSSVPMIRADAKRLSRILYHLIDNAVKFGPEKGMVRIEFEVVGENLAIRVVDRGIGIPTEKVNKIFESFYQVDNKSTRIYEGMGIGLTLTMKLVAGTGGKMQVTSQPGEGTAFALIYPVG